MSTKSTETRKQQHSADNRQLRILRLIDEGTAAQTGANETHQALEQVKVDLDSVRKVYADLKRAVDAGLQLKVFVDEQGLSKAQAQIAELAKSDDAKIAAKMAPRVSAPIVPASQSPANLANGAEVAELKKANGQAGGWLNDQLASIVKIAGI